MTAAGSAACMQGHGPGGDLTKLLKRPLPAMLRLFLGHRTNVVALQVLRC